MFKNPGLTSDTLVPDALIAGMNIAAITRDGTILTGNSLSRGDLLGKIALGAASVEADGGNTGNGVLTMNATPLGTLAQAGAYVLTCIAAASNAGTFQVRAPDGTLLPQATVAVAYTGDHIQFTIADGGTDFAVGDKITVTVAEGSGKYKKSLAAALDGSQNPVAILAADTDATSADTNAPLYVTGEFNENEVSFGTGHTADSVREALRDLNIHLKPAVTAVAP